MFVTITKRGNDYFCNIKKSIMLEYSLKTMLDREYIYVIY